MTEFIGIDPDTPVFRIFSLLRFEDTLRNRELVLVSPECWTDRFEVLPHRTVVTIDGLPGFAYMFAPYLAPAYAQCWSRSSESDVLMRAYSRVVNSRTEKDCDSERNICPSEEGVRIRSTPRKLMQALKDSSSRECSCFIGAIEYGPQELIKSKLSELATRIVTERVEQADSDMTQAILTSAERILGPLDMSARLLLLKRRAFEQEAEVRVILVSHGVESGRRIIKIPFDPTEVFDDCDI